MPAEFPVPTAVIPDCVLLVSPVADEAEAEKEALLTPADVDANRTAGLQATAAAATCRPPCRKTRLVGGVVVVARSRGIIFLGVEARQFSVHLVVRGVGRRFGPVFGLG